MGKKRKRIKISKETAEGIMAVAKVAALIGTIAYTIKGRSPTSMNKANDIAVADLSV